MIKKISLSSIIFVFLLVLVNIFLQFLPLTSVIGYEYSVINAVLLFLVNGIYWISSSRKGNSSKKKIWTSILFFFIPFIISIFNTLFFGKCPIWLGLPFYFVITLPALIFGSIVAQLIVKLFNRYQITIFIILFLLIAVEPIVEIFINPQIYFYNLIIGYFPGTIYDEAIAIDSKLIYYRVFNLLFLYGLLLFVRKYYSSFKKIFLIGGTVLISLIWFYFIKPSYNYFTTNTKIKSVLTKKIESKHFDIYYAPEMNVDSASLLGLHEFYFNELEHELKTKFNKRITSYIFRDQTQKKQLFGSKNADVAKPWLNQIYLDSETYSSSLKHELVHIFGAEYGSTIFKVADNFNPAMIEGFAMAFENKVSFMDVDFLAKMAYLSGYKFPISQLFTGLNFFTQNSSMGYVYSGSFIRFLVKNYGVKKVEKLYSDTDFSKIYGKSVQILEKEYYNFLDTLSYKINKSTAQLYFARPGLIKKICPRYASLITREAWQNYYNKEYKKAFTKFNQLYKYSESYESVDGIIESSIKLGKIDSALNFASTQLIKFKNSSYFYSLEFSVAELMVLKGDSAKAMNYYNRIISEAPNPGYTISAKLRKNLLLEGLPELKTYLIGDNKSRLKLLSLLQNNGENQNIYSYYIVILSSSSEPYNDLKQKLNFDLDERGFLSAYIFFQISRYSYMKGDLEFAELLAEKAMKMNKRKEYVYNFRENVELIKWAKKNYPDLLDETKK